MSETTTHDLETVMRTALAGIALHWDAMMVPTSAGGTGGGSASARITAADHADTEADIDRPTRVVSLRRLTTDVLNGWSRVVMEDRPAKTMLRCEHGLTVTLRWPFVGPTRVACALGRPWPIDDEDGRPLVGLHTIDGTDVRELTAFLDRHAQWMSGHDAAQDCADELADLDRRITALVMPMRREWMSLGSCPLKGEDGTVCGGQVRAWPRNEDRPGETMGRCRTCGTEAVTTWWESQMFDQPELKVWLTDADLVMFVHSTFGKVITESTIRQWVKRKVLSASGSDDKGRRLFHREAVVYALDLHDKRARTRA